MTKFVKGGIPKNFITDKDILITSVNHSGETLEDIFDDVVCLFLWWCRW